MKKKIVLRILEGVYHQIYLRHSLLYRLEHWQWPTNIGLCEMLSRSIDEANADNFILFSETYEYYFQIKYLLSCESSFHNRKDVNLFWWPKNDTKNRIATVRAVIQNVENDKYPAMISE